MAATSIVERIRVVDADTHVTEPGDLWTSRLARKWNDRVPHVRFDAARGEDCWFIGDKRVAAAGGSAMAGWREFPPSHPARLDEADPACWDPHQRLKRMDEYGIWAQILYPNVGGFGSGRFLELREPELMLDCVRAYNDFLTEWASADPKRLIPITAVPFWDVKAAVTEVERCAKLGHRGVLFTSEPDAFGEPALGDPHWDPLFAAAQDIGHPINFHIGSGEMTVLTSGYRGAGRQANYAKATVQLFINNSRAVMEVITSGICHRFPRLNIVSVESGVGWIPFTLEALDWQWFNSGVHLEHPEYDLKPSEYFRRQIYGCFWFERASAKAAIDQLGPDNLLYETDFPHPTSMSPGPASFAVPAHQFIEESMGDLPEDVLRKLLHENAARLYHLD